MLPIESSWPVEPGDYLPFDPPHADDPNTLLGARVAYNRREWFVVEWKFSLGDTWVLLIAATGWRSVWALADDVQVLRG